MKTRTFNMSCSMILFSVMVLVSFPQSLIAQETVKVAGIKINPSLLSGHWPAFWIAHPEASGLEYGVYHFRRNFDLPEKPGAFVVHLSADNRHFPLE